MLIYIIDDEKNIRRSFEIILRPKRCRVKTYESAELGIADLREEAADLIFLDVLLPGMNGIDALKKIRKISPATDVVMISGHANLGMAVEATRAGAYDFLEKPLKKEKILLTLQHLQQQRQLASKFASLQANMDEKYEIIGESDSLKTVLGHVRKVAPTDSKVLITGESGVGKELIAYAIHRNSPRVEEPFIKMNCAAIPEELTESELFGSEKGAYTGSTERRDGKFMQAHGGTLFLDEIGDMSLKAQTKVLRALQEGEVQRIGGSEIIKVDVRVIAATNKDLPQMVQEGSFREDLYFRLNVLPIEVPPLRERRVDIPALVNHFSQRYAERNNRRAMLFDQAALDILADYHWPGNIRELQNVIERLIILADGETISAAEIPLDLKASSFTVKQITPGSKSLNEVRAEAERQYIQHCLDSVGGNVSQAARLLGVERTNLHKKMKTLGVR